MKSVHGHVFCWIQFPFSNTQRELQLSTLTLNISPNKINCYTLFQALWNSLIHLHFGAQVGQYASTGSQRKHYKKCFSAHKKMGIICKFLVATFFQIGSVYLCSGEAWLLYEMTAWFNLQFEGLFWEFLLLSTWMGFMGNMTQVIWWQCVLTTSQSWSGKHGSQRCQ